MGTKNFIHIDLFSGIGGFAKAIDAVWPNVEHIFCDNNRFCQEVLKKRWPGSYIYADIREFTADTLCTDGGGKCNEILQNQRRKTGEDRGEGIQSENGEACANNIKQSCLHVTDAESKRRGEEGRYIKRPKERIAGKDIKFSPNPTGGKSGEPAEQKRGQGIGGRSGEVFILTGGFPCQPVSQAGKRKGKEDERFLWPEMFRVIREFRPTWVIAENVYGLLTIEQGVVFEQVCSDLESEGYEVQAFIIPACAVDAPHRRDRVWIIASNINSKRSGTQEHGNNGIGKKKNQGRNGQSQPGFDGYDSIASDADNGRQKIKEQQAAGDKQCGGGITTDTGSQYGVEGRVQGIQKDKSKRSSRTTDFKRKGGGDIKKEQIYRHDECVSLQGVGKEQDSSQSDRLHGGKDFGWDQDWVKVASELCRVADELPVKLDGFKLSKGKHREERLKALGNAIVPAVAIEIFKAIKYAEDSK